MSQPTKTEASLIGAWAQRAGDALDLLAVAAVAPALVKPEAVDQAAKAANEARRQLRQVEHLADPTPAGLPAGPIPRWAFWSYL